MAQTNIQEQVQQQTQSQSTLQMALSSLIALPVTALAERVRDEMLDNAALEPCDDEGDTADIADAERNDDGETGDELSRELDDYLTEDDVPAYLRERADASAESAERPVVAGRTAYDDLMAQIGDHDLDAHRRSIIEYLIGSLDDDGYLRVEPDTMVDELAIYHGVTTTPGEVAEMIAELQTFEPRGIGARTLRECLRLQLTDPDLHSPYRLDALRVLDDFFDEFSAKRWDTITARMGMNRERAEHVRHLIEHLTPRPATALGTVDAVTAPTVLPDFYVHIGPDGEPAVTLNDSEVPPLRVSPAFRDSITQYAARRSSLSREQHDAYTYARQKVEAAQTFIGLIQRRRRTLLGVMEAIVALQRDFFVENDDEDLLHPMTLRDVAQRVDVDISTVSRVTGSKYVETDFGIYPLKHFFSLQFTTEAGDEISSRRVRAALSEIVAGEDRRHPYSDERLAVLLSERGMDVARRTVTKYRETMGILSSRLRRES